MVDSQPGLFLLPGGARRPRAQVIILTGPSGSGKTSLASRVGLPSISLDNFYRDQGDPRIPMLSEEVADWDDPRSWNGDQALEALTELCLTGMASVPIYDIPSNRRTGTRTVSLGDNQLFIAEGIFAAELVSALMDEGLLADALCIARSSLKNAWFRLLRDMAEARKPLPVLLWRGAKLARMEPGKIKRWKSQGCRSVQSLTEAQESIELLYQRLRLRDDYAQRSDEL